MRLRIVILCSLIVLVANVTGSLVFAEKAPDWKHKIYSDKKNGYFSMIPPSGWVRKDYTDARTKVAWQQPVDQRIFIRIIARDAVQSYDQMIRGKRQVMRNLTRQGRVAKFTETTLEIAGKKAIAFDFDMRGAGFGRLLFFLADGVHFNCQYGAPSFSIYQKHLNEAMKALGSITVLPRKMTDSKKRKEQELSWYRRYSYLLENMGDTQAARAIAREGLKKFPNDEELRARASK